MALELSHRACLCQNINISVSVEIKAGLTKRRIFSTIIELCIFKDLCQHETISTHHTSVSNVNEGSYAGGETRTQEVNCQKWTSKSVASGDDKCLTAGSVANTIKLPFYVTCMQMFHLLQEIKKLFGILMASWNYEILISVILVNRGSNQTVWVCWLY